MPELAPKAHDAAARRSDPNSQPATRGRRQRNATTYRGFVDVRRGLRAGAIGVPVAFALAASAPAHAVDCDTTLSACFDANNMNIPAGPAEFVSIEKATTLEPGNLAVGLVGSYLRKPVVLVAPSPSPEGREVPLVEDIWQLDLLAAIGVLPKLQLTLAFPFRPSQDGAGIEAASSRQGGSLRETAVVDPRIGASYQFFDEIVAAKLRFEVELPLGDEDAFAGSNAPMLIPALLVSSKDLGRFHLAADIGARFGESVQLGDVRIGSQLRFALGARYDVLPELSVGVEGWILPSLVEQPETAAGQGSFVPAEWMGSVSTTIVPHMTFLAAAGTGIPLSQGPGSSDNDIGVTTPLWRTLLSIRVSE